jgi:hypothetical protein
MKIYLLLFTFLLSGLFSLSARCQETAMDFTQDDCEGSSHHLFTELDAGKVIILEYVMLNCAPCINGTKALENITAPYEISHPGRVRIYSFGFLNSYTCEQIVAWKNDNNFIHPVFNNGEEQVAYYGGMGMPTIVVTGTNEHKVFCKSIGYTPAVDAEIKAAIDSALLYNPTGIGEKIATDHLSVYPTLFTGSFNIEADEALSGSEVVIFDSFGREVMEDVIPASGRLAIDGSSFAKGMYFVRLEGGQGISVTAKLIRQ